MGGSAGDGKFGGVAEGNGAEERAIGGIGSGDGENRMVEVEKNIRRNLPELGDYLRVVRILADLLI